MGLKSSENIEFLVQLAQTIAARKTADAETSYTASLISKGVHRCAKKFGEEAIEVVLAAASGDRDHTAAEAADVLYHLLVLLEAADVSLDSVLSELAQRRGISGHTEKAARGT